MSRPDLPADTHDAVSLVEGAIARSSQLASLPEVALEAMRLADDPQATGEDLERVLSSDPALSARVLKIVNSAFYGARRDVSSIRVAIMVLGFGAIKSIAVASSLTRAFRGARIADGFEARDLWTHSVAVATGARQVALNAGSIDPDDAFLGGLMHDIGVMVELQAFREPFVSMIRALASDPTLTFRQAEGRHIGATHEAFGAALCRAWRFPLSLERVCGFHHVPRDLPADDRRLTAIVHVADILAAECGLGYSRTVEREPLDRELCASLGLTDAALDRMRAALPGQVSDVLPLLGGVR